MYYNYYMSRDGRGAFVVPLLLGGLLGGAAVGVSRPRPVYVTNPYSQPYYPGMYPGSYYGNYGYFNYLG